VPRQPRGLPVLVTFDVVQDECRPVTRREHQHRLLDREPINQLLAGIGAARHSQPRLRNFSVTRLYFRPRAAIAEMHLDLIDHDAVEPCGERRLAPETADPARPTRKIPASSFRRPLRCLSYEMRRCKQSFCDDCRSRRRPPRFHSPPDAQVLRRVDLSGYTRQH
jgi:hypothetical protein